MSLPLKPPLRVLWSRDRARLTKAHLGPQLNFPIYPNLRNMEGVSQQEGGGGLVNPGD